MSVDVEKTPRKLGQKGEEEACNYLKDKGYKILFRNYTCRTGEIDILALKRGELHFVEVKLRSTRSLALPAESVSQSKIRRILSAANCFLCSKHGKNYQSAPCHFDVISVNYGELKSEITFIPDAFEADDS